MPPSSLRDLRLHLHSCTQEGAMSLCPGQGPQLLPGEGVICLLATSFLLLDLLTFGHMQLISQAPVVSQAPVQCHLECHQGCFYLLSEPGWQVGCPGSCPLTGPAAPGKVFMRLSSQSIKPQPPFQTHRTFLFCYNHCEGRLKLSWFISQMQPGQHIAKQ